MKIINARPDMNNPGHLFIDSIEEVEDTRPINYTEDRGDADKPRTANHPFICILYFASVMVASSIVVSSSFYFHEKMSYLVADNWLVLCGISAGFISLISFLLYVLLFRKVKWDE